MSCLVCCVDYYISGEENQSVVSSLTQSSESSNICSFICDSGKQCKLKKIEEDLCNIHCVYRTKITCPFCLADYCRICYRKYFLSSLEEPHCMNCKKGFSVEFLLGYDEHIQRFSNKFVWGAFKRTQRRCSFRSDYGTSPYFSINSN